jgi:uncharacterized lipoprotein YmbA
MTLSAIGLALLLAACEGGGPGVETLLLPGSSQVNLTVTSGPSCPVPVVSVAKH